MTFLLLLGAGAGSGDGGDSGALQPAASGSSPTGGEGLSNSPYTPTIAIDIHEPLAAGGELINSSIIINSYSHTINAVGGFDTATFTMAANMNMINEWLVSGPMRHIIVKESAGSTIWEGFVDSLDLLDPIRPFPTQSEATSDDMVVSIFSRNVFVGLQDHCRLGLFWLLLILP